MKPKPPRPWASLGLPLEALLRRPEADPAVQSFLAAEATPHERREQAVVKAAYLISDLRGVAVGLQDGRVSSLSFDLIIGPREPGRQRLIHHAYQGMYLAGWLELGDKERVRAAMGPLKFSHSWRDLAGRFEGGLDKFERDGHDLSFSYDAEGRISGVALRRHRENEDEVFFPAPSWK